MCVLHERLREAKQSIAENASTYFSDKMKNQEPISPFIMAESLISIADEFMEYPKRLGEQRGIIPEDIKAQLVEVEGKTKALEDSILSTLEFAGEALEIPPAAVVEALIGATLTAMHAFNHVAEEIEGEVKSELSPSTDFNMSTETKVEVDQMLNNFLKDLKSK